MSNPKEGDSIEEPTKVDDMTNEQLGEIIRDSINLSELTLRGSVQMIENPLEAEVINGIVGLVTEVWRAKELNDLFPLAKEVDAVENPGSRTFEVRLDRDYLSGTPMDRLQSSVVEHLTPIRVPKLPPSLRSYTTTALRALHMMKEAEKPKPPSPYSRYL